MYKNVLLLIGPLSEEDVRDYEAFLFSSVETVVVCASLKTPVCEAVNG